MQITLMSLSIFLAATTVDIDDMSFRYTTENARRSARARRRQWVHLRTHLRCSQRCDLSAPGHPGQRLFKSINQSSGLGLQARL